MNQLPLWAQWTQFAATIGIAAFAGTIALLQWRTARTKLALDLFEKRFEVFMDVRRIASEAQQLGKLNDAGLPHEVLARGRFLFGPEIQKNLEDLHLMTIELETGDGEAIGNIRAKFDEMIPQFQRYLRMQQKVPLWL